MQEININKIFNFINPKLGINYNFLKYNSVYASFAMANREPTRKDFVNAEKGRTHYQNNYMILNSAIV